MMNENLEWTKRVMARWRAEDERLHVVYFPGLLRSASSPYARDSKGKARVSQCG